MMVKLVSSMIERGQLILLLTQQCLSFVNLRSISRFYDFIRCLEEDHGDRGLEIPWPVNHWTILVGHNKKRQKDIKLPGNAISSRKVLAAISRRPVFKTTQMIPLRKVSSF